MFDETLASDWVWEETRLHSVWIPVPSLGGGRVWWFTIDQLVHTFRLLRDNQIARRVHVGRGGRDSETSCALLLYGPGLYKYAEASVKDYCEKNEVYRRELLYKDFSCYTHNWEVNSGCWCCDVCLKCCVNPSVGF